MLVLWYQSDVWRATKHLIFGPFCLNIGGHGKIIAITKYRCLALVVCCVVHPPLGKLPYRDTSNATMWSRGFYLIRCLIFHHYDGVIMGTIASQISSLTIVYFDADQRKYQSSASLAFVRGIHRGPVISLHKWPVTREMLPFDDVMMMMRDSAENIRPQSWSNGKQFAKYQGYAIGCKMIGAFRIGSVKNSSWSRRWPSPWLQ